MRTAATDAPFAAQILRWQCFLNAFAELNRLRNSSEHRSQRLDVFFQKFSRLRSGSTRSPIAVNKPLSVSGIEDFLGAFIPLAKRLRAQGELIDIWNISGLKRSELRIASVLAWLFDPNQSHGRGSSIFNAFLRRLALTHQGQFPLPRSDLLDYAVVTESYPIGNDENRVDIVIDGTDFLAFIEVKVDAPEGPDQIDRYLDLAKAKSRIAGKQNYAVVFLSPRRSTITTTNFIAATWSDVADAIDVVMTGDLRNFGTRVLLQFARYVRRL